MLPDAEGGSLSTPDLDPSESDLLAATISEETLVETLLLDSKERDPPTLATVTLAVAHSAGSPFRLPRFKSYNAWPLRFLHGTICVFLLLALSSISIFIIGSHLDYLDSSLSLPRGILPELSFGPRQALLDGPPPKPLYWANFPALYDLQHRMIEHSLNAILLDGDTMLKFIADGLRDKASNLYQSGMEVERKDRIKGQALWKALRAGAALGEKGAGVHVQVRQTVERLLRESQRASKGIEDSMVNQPESPLARAFALLLPLSHRPSIWPWIWATDLEVRWQFYHSLTVFSGQLYKTLLALVELQSEIEEYGKDLNTLQTMLAKEEKVDPMPPPVANTTKTGVLSALFRTARPEIGAPHNPPADEKNVHEEDADEKYELTKEALLDRLVKGVQVALLERVGCALLDLRVLAEEVESLRYQVAEPASVHDPHVSIYVHLKEVHIAEFSLRVEVERLQALEEVWKKGKGKGN
ncbi:hypothetical protein NMY22_g1816 [Coprinellus aureogranulatus]|nr:hypothetical protein NMY22_g1816 [Coprinellus aureogranulatus]